MTTQRVSMTDNDYEYKVRWRWLGPLGCIDRFLTKKGEFRNIINRIELIMQ